MNQTILTIAFLLLLQGCQLVGEKQEQGVFLETDRTEYQVQDTISASLHNRTGLSIESGVCDLWFQRLNEGEWERVISPVLDIRACPSIAISFDPGEGGPIARRAVEPWMKVGTYRLEYTYTVENDLIQREMGEPLDIRYIYSEPFMVFEPIVAAFN